MKLVYMQTVVDEVIVDGNDRNSDVLHLTINCTNLPTFSQMLTKTPNTPKPQNPKTQKLHQTSEVA